ncbi:hypothetical protein D3C87_1943610 [compost metagenome]
MNAFYELFLFQKNRFFDLLSIVRPENGREVAADRPAPFGDVFFLYLFIEFFFQEVLKELQGRSVVKYL